MPDPLADAIRRIQDADREAERAVLAYRLGRFDEYLQGEIDVIQQRTEQRYDELNAEPVGNAAGSSGGVGGAGS